MLYSDLVRSALDSTPDAMVIIDSSDAIVFSNCQISAVFGYEAHEIAGRNIEVLLPDLFRSPRVQPLGNGLDLFARRNDGTEFPVDISLRPMSCGSVTLTAASIRDVTARRALEVELKAARAAADSANQAKCQLLETASHDLRQPLQTLALLNCALRRMINDSGPAEALAQQDLAIRAMSRLLNALLDISKLESGAIKPEMADPPIVEISAGMRTNSAGLAAHS